MDTMILMWGVRGFATPGQESKIRRAKHFVESFKSKDRVIVPAPVVAEFLVRLTDAERAENMQVLETQFRIVPMDALAALHAGRLQAKRDHQDDDLPRERFKFDTLIIGCAMASKADYIVTHNVSEFRKIADGQIEIRDLPNPDIPLTLPGIMEGQSDDC